MIKFGSFYGVVKAINDFWTGNEETSGCYRLITVQTRDRNIVNFVVSPFTYFVEYAMVSVGDMITGYYNADAPVPLIYPMQIQAIVIVKDMFNINVKVDHFNNQLVSSDGMLKIIPSMQTKIVLVNNQEFYDNIENHNLIVIYGPSTRSIPAQTTPFKIVVLCL